MKRASRSVRGVPPILLLTVLLPACSGGGPARPGEGAAAGGEPGATGPGSSVAAGLAHGDEAYRVGDYPEAQTAYQEVLRLDPDQPHAVAALATAWLKTNQVKTAEDLVAAYLGRRPGDLNARLVLGRTLIREGDYPRAAEALETVLKGDPDNLMALYNLGFIAYRTRGYERAQTLLQRVIALKPEHPEAHYTLGLTNLALGRTAEAIAELERAVQIDPKHVGAHFNLVGAYQRAGRRAEAEREQRVYADLSGRSKAKEEKESQIRSQMVEPMQLVKDRRYEEALSRYRDLAARYPDYAPLQHQVGVVSLRLGRRSEALDALRKAVRLDPRLSDSHYLLANLYREQGDRAEADRELQIFATLETIPEGKSGY
jgi:tetratricopeptide (TPR) repeat protein